MFTVGGAVITKEVRIIAASAALFMTHNTSSPIVIIDVKTWKLNYVLSVKIEHQFKTSVEKWEFALTIGYA